MTSLEIGVVSLSEEDIIKDIKGVTVWSMIRANITCDG